MRKKNWKRKRKSARDRFIDSWAARSVDLLHRTRAEALRWEELFCNNPALVDELEPRLASSRGTLPL